MEEVRLAGIFWTSFAVMKQVAASNLYALRASAGGLYTLHERNDGYILVSGGDNLGYIAPAGYGSAFHVFASQSYAAVDMVCQLWVDGTRMPMTPMGQAAGTFDNLGVGDGDIAEVIHYGRQLNATEIANVSKYLGTRFGLTVAGGTAVAPDSVPGLLAWWKADSL